MRPASGLLLALLLSLVGAGPGTPAAAATDTCGEGSRSTPRTVTIRTIPPLAQAAIRLDGRPLPGDGRGSFVADRLCVSQALERLSAEQVVTIRPGVQQHLSRWVTSRKDAEVTAVYDVQRKVSFRFQRLDGKAVPAEELDEYVLRSSTGGVTTTRSSAQWLQSERVVPTPDGLRVKKIYYTVDSVRVDSSEVVYRSQQRFVPAENNAVTIELLYFPIRVSTRDSLFGFPIGDAVLLTHPDGRTTRHPLTDGRTDLPALPRGEYMIQVEAPAPTVVRPLALSRPQEVDLAVLSWLDLGAMGGTVLVLAGALLLVRRPHLRTPQRYLATALSRVVHTRTSRARHAAPVQAPGLHLPLGPAPPSLRVHHTGWPASPSASTPCPTARAPLGWPDQPQTSACRPYGGCGRAGHSPSCRRAVRAEHRTSTREARAR